ncbi:hypothetical protein F0726_01615 [Acidithiobacillus caldus]|nr:hypothetical protein F0726_01615 [Acidithiobacillus caldus]
MTLASIVLSQHATMGWRLGEMVHLCIQYVNT